MAIRQDDLEAKGFLSSTEDGLHEDIVNTQHFRRDAPSRMFQILLIVMFTAAGFSLGRLSVGSQGEMGGLAPYSPATPLVEYHRKRFDQGYGENTTDGRRLVYGGPANAEVDKAWDDLEFGKYVRLSEQEASQLETPTASLHANGGYIVSLDVYHQLHCLNYLRMALQPHHYKFDQSPEALEHHIAHCVNDLRQSIQCFADITPMGFTRTTWEGKIAYDPQFEVRRTCRNWNKIHSWARERSLLNDPDLELVII